jgi:SdrD B-like domain/Putative Ig domain
VSIAPAQAAVTQGCISSGFQPQNCYSQRTPITDIVAVINTSASTSATVSGSCTSPTFTLSAASTPGTYITSVAGLTFNTSTGTLSGTTQGTAFATTNYFILATCSNSSQEAFTFSVTVTAAATPVILPATQNVDATTNSAITNSTAFTATNFSGTVAYTVSPTLPTGLQINSSTGVISGTPTAAQSATPYTVTATYTTQTATATVTITVTNPAAPSITPGSQTVSGTAGSAISSTTAFTAANFGGTVVYSVSPTLPTGLQLNTSTGVISGTPTATQSATSYTVTGTYNAQTATATVSITVAAVQVAEPEPPSRKVTICHRTHSETNPYVRITVDYNSVNKKSGHQGHDEIFAGEHVFKAGIYKRAKDKLWGDIIPADPSGLNRWQPLNWTFLGVQIYSGIVGGCPSYDPVTYYNTQREAGVPEAKLKKEMSDIETELQEGNPGTKRVDPITIKYTGKNENVAEQENDKVTICHRTRATTNPYVRITVSTSSITNPAGHYEHDEIYAGHHVYDSAVTYPNNQKLWGDIIPADPTGKNRWQPLNWTALGQSIYNGTTAGCGEQSVQETYNKLRESGLPKKQVMEEIEKQKSVDVDPKDIDELTYKGTDPEVAKKEPKEPQLPANVSTPEQSLSGIIWLDRNKDGLKDPDEPYLPDVTLTLVPANAVPGATGVQVKTDANGLYQFTSIAPGEWKVVTTIPTDLEITYDSEGLHQGEMQASVPSGGRAFTWAGLAGTSELVDKHTLEVLLLNNPTALPAEEIPSWLKTKLAAIASKDKKTDGVLAATGTNVLIWLFFGLLLTAAGGFIAFGIRKRS